MTFAGVEAAGNTKNVIMIRTRKTFRSFTLPPVRPPLEKDKGGGSHLLSLSAVSQKFSMDRLSTKVAFKACKGGFELWRP